jgi:cytochrome c556
MLRGALTTCLLLALPTLAPSSDPAAAIQYRQSAYTVMVWNWAPMAAMVRGRTPWDQDEFARRAQRVATLVPMLIEGFPPGSNQGAETAAKGEIWSNFDDFRAKMQALERESAALAKVAAGGDEAATRAQFGKTAETCKACHDRYKAD